MWGSSDTKQLENFDESIIGKPSIFLTAAAAATNIQPYWYTVASNRAQYGRRILITNDIGASVSVGIEWEAIFRPREAVDYSLILSYILNSVNPVYIQSDIELPEQFVTALYTKAPRHVVPATLIVLLHAGVLPRSIRLYHNIFFPHIAEHGSAEAAKYISFIHSSGLSNVGDDELRAYIKELRIAGGGLVWSKLGQAIYWYDPADCRAPAATTPAARAAIQKQIANTLHKIAAQLDSTLV